MGCKDFGIRKPEFVVKTQFLCPILDQIKTETIIQVLSYMGYSVMGSRGTFKFPSRVDLSGPSLYCIARKLGN